MFSNFRSLIFKLDPETAHSLAIKSLKFNFIPTGKKDAFIVSDTFTTTRTSFVKNIEDGKILKNTIKIVNKNCDWLHVCYIDDIEELPEDEGNINQIEMEL